MIELYLRYTDGTEYTETHKVAQVPPEVLLSDLMRSARRAGNTIEEARYRPVEAAYGNQTTTF
jgi:hypothetical protein